MSPREARQKPGSPHSQLLESPSPPSPATSPSLSSVSIFNHSLINNYLLSTCYVLGSELGPFSPLPPFPHPPSDPPTTPPTGQGGKWPSATMPPLAQEGPETLTCSPVWVWTPAGKLPTSGHRAQASRTLSSHGKSSSCPKHTLSTTDMFWTQASCGT